MRKILQNISKLTQGPHAVADPCVSVYGQQQHIGYRDANGEVWDSWYDGKGTWNLQRINALGMTNGPAAFAGPFIGVFLDQQHFAYLDKAGIIWDSWYDGKGTWQLQQINYLESGDLWAFIDRSPGAPLPVVAVWNDSSGDQQHFTYLTVDPFFFSDIFFSLGEDSWYPGLLVIPNTWTRQKLQDAGVQPGSGPFVSVFGDQQHVAYIDAANSSIVDHWYDGDGHWNVQRITAGTVSDSRFGNTNGPAILHGTHPAIWVDHSNTQQHFTYVGADRAIYDAFWNGNTKVWTLQKLTLGGETDGPAAWSSPSVCNYAPDGSNNTVYVAYHDQHGTIWTIAYGSGPWVALLLKDLPLGSPPDSTVELPPAAGDVRVWVDDSGNQIHFTFRVGDAGGPIISSGPPVSREARVAPANRRPPTTSAADSGPADLVRATGVIWDFFYEP